RDGELYNGDQLIRKSLAELFNVAVLVHDDTYRASQARSSPHTRWCPHSSNSAWRATDEGYGAAVDALSPDWLVYQHAIATAVPGDRRRASPVTDNYGCNQGL